MLPKTFSLTLLLFAPVASGVVLIDDRFDLPPGSATSGDDVADPTDVAWNSIGAASLSVGNRDGFTGQALGNLASGTNFRSSRGDWGGTVNLTTIGDTLSYSLSIQTNNAPVLPNQQAGYSVGLFNAANEGYFFFIGVGGNTNFSLHHDNGTGNPANAYSGNGVTVLGTPGTATSINANVTLEASLTLTRVASGIQVDAVFDGNNLSFTDTSSPITSFTGATNGTGNHSIDWWVDDILVESSVPEPSTALLGVISLLGLLCRRR